MRFYPFSKHFQIAQAQVKRTGPGAAPLVCLDFLSRWEMGASRGSWARPAQGDVAPGATGRSEREGDPVTEQREPKGISARGLPAGSSRAWSSDSRKGPSWDRGHD